MKREQLYSSFWNGQFKQFAEQIEEFGFENFIVSVNYDVADYVLTAETALKMIDRAARLKGGE